MRRNAMQAAGLDGIELEAYGHLLEQFWSPLTNSLDEPYGGSLEIGCNLPSKCCRPSANASVRNSF